MLTLRRVCTLSLLLSVCRAERVLPAFVIGAHLFDARRNVALLSSPVALVAAAMLLNHDLCQQISNVRMFQACLGSSLWRVCFIAVDQSKTARTTYGVECSPFPPGGLTLHINSEQQSSNMNLRSHHPRYRYGMAATLRHKVALRTLQIIETST